MQSQGVDAPVTFNIASGIYDEQVEIPAITGAGPVNTVTFQSNTGNAENVEITFKATSAKPYTVLLEGANYVNFENLTITATDSTYSTALEMAGSCSNISIGNCIINSLHNTTNTAAIYSTDNFHENIDIYGNTINDGLYGIFLDGENSGLSNNLAIMGNTIQDQYAGGIYISDYIAPSVNANTIISDSITYNYYAIYLKNCNNAYTISKNQITVFDKYGGINVENSDGLNVNFGMITNNMINLKGEGMITMNGISTRNSDYVNVYFNTVRIIGSNTSAMSNAYYNYGGSYLKILNNIFCNFGSGRAYFTTNLASIFSSDHNCLFTAGDLIAATGNSYYPTLDLFSQATSKDTNSIVVNPAFLADSDLHANSWFLDGAGVLIAGQDEDFDGDIRAIPPDIGADEYTSTLYPLDDGTYTIGGISPHYNTIKEAMDDVQQRGVLAQTTFKIRTGEYNEYLGNIYKIPGSNAENPVILISETGNNENVTISFSTTSEEGSIFDLKNVDYFTNKRFNNLSPGRLIWKTNKDNR